jgi:hypothetical protein
MPLLELQPGEARRRGQARSNQLIDTPTSTRGKAHSLQDRENQPPSGALDTLPFPRPSEFTAWRRAAGAHTAGGGGGGRESVGATCNPSAPTTVQLAHSKEVAWLHFRKVPLGHTATLRMRVHNPQLAPQVRNG